MIDLAYVQKSPETGEFITESTYCFWHGCHQMGIDTVSFVPDEMDRLPLTKETAVQGGIGMVRKAFRRLGVPQPTVGEMPPDVLLEFYGRRLWATTMAEVRQGYEDNRHFFVKPLRLHKEFSGHVTSGSIAQLTQTAHLPADFEILASEVLEFQSEYRLFIHNRKVAACRHYRGDSQKVIDLRVADAVLTSWPDQPVAYSLDLGVGYDDQTYVVEINDAFSLGTYGIASIPYARMVLERR